jgi:aerobic-type carbon monoxide dehydrogenase small subunit (CoxS/CutS family)
VKQIQYTCPYCGMNAVDIEGLKNHVVSQHGTEPLPLSPRAIGLTINQQIYELKVEPEWTLYQVIHDKLGFIGAKMFCDRGTCGSCTVIMEGRPILSCMTLAIECDGKTIETVEGIGEKDHPLIEKYVEHHAMQCGYCTPGFVVTAKALLDRNPDPSEAEVKEALAGNLCRCGTYPQHIKAVMETAEKMKAE